MAVVVLTSCASQEEAVVANQEMASNLDCRKIRHTGSRVPERVCKTAVEWEREAEDNQENLRDHQMESNTSGGVD